MAKLIGQLLTMTRMEQGTQPLERERVALDGLVRDVTGEPAYAGEHIALELEPVTAEGDSQLLGRVLGNLLENALRYGHREGEAPEITVRTWGEGDDALLSVADRGPGIPEGEREKIWQRFYQVDPSRTGEEGAGLGLSMARQIARLHGGDLTLESGPWGSRFTLKLPRK